MSEQLTHYWQNIIGWFHESDTAFYKKMIDQVSEPAHFVEVGCWKGKSSSYMAVEIVNSGKPIQFDCVDTWLGDLNDPIHQNDPSVAGGTLYDEFIQNMKPVEGKYKAVRMDSVSAAATYEDNSLDLVFIDAAHDYESVKADILAWLPKIKINGIISGHDYGHPPVRQAVHEFLTDVNDGSGGPWFTVKK